MAKVKSVLFSVDIKSCDVETFRCPGHGGQNVNKVESGVRIKHRASGAVGQSCDTRDQFRNKRIAFRRMAETKEFKTWIKVETARQLGKPSVEQVVNKLMDPRNIRVEVRDDKTGRWTEVTEQNLVGV